MKNKVIVIGGGIAGLSCAKILRDLGYTVTLLEASHRLGGRLLSQQTKNGSSFELGASFILNDSSKGHSHSLISLLKHCGISLMPVKRKQSLVYDSDGKVIDFNALLKSLYDPFRASIMKIQEAKQVIAKQKAKKSNFPSLEEILGLTSIPKDEEHDDWEKKLINAMIMQHTGASPRNVSILELMTNYAPKQLFYIAGDSQKLIDNLVSTKNMATSNMTADNSANNQSNGLTVHLNTEIVQIHHFEGSQEVRAITPQKREYKAEAIVCTVPLNVLKFGDLQFSPPLSKEKQKAIANLEMGDQNNIILEFEKPFWPIDAHFIYPNSPNINEWPSYFNLVPFSHGKLIALCAQYFGDDADFSEKSDAELVEKAMEPLRRIFGKECLPPKAFHISRWDSDEYCLGSITYCGLKTNEDDLENMAKPEVGGLFFAGEHTAKGLKGTLQGAYESGARAALEVDAFLKIKYKEEYRNLFRPSKR